MAEAATSKVFGIPLATVMARSSERTIPSFLINIFRYLNVNAGTTEAVFRLAPKMKILNLVKEKIDAGGEIDYAEYKDTHLVANLLKIYLRELPEPLFTFDLYPQFVAAASEYETELNLRRGRSTAFDSDDSTIVEKYRTSLRALIDKLPTANKALTEILFLLLCKVAEHTSNKMTPANLGIAFGQILLKPESETVESMMNAAKITNIVRFMIEQTELIFPKDPKPQMDRKQSMKLAEGEEKIQKIKDTVDDAIVLVQKKLNSLSSQLQETEQLDVAIEIARRVRTAKKVLFPPGEEPKSKRLVPTSKKSVCGFTLLSACAERQGKRKTMEDASVLIDDLTKEFTNLPKGQMWAFYAVYDGHGGSFTSDICSKKLHSTLCNNANLMRGNIKTAMEESYRDTDAYALEMGQKNSSGDGSTAVTALIHENSLYIANAGDSEAVICNVKPDGTVQAVVISKIHRPTCPEEKQRIEKAGGAVFSGRVFGALAVSRSLGDGDFKIPVSDANFVSAVPYLDQIALTKETSFLLLACDGLFDKLTPQESVDFVHERIQKDEELSSIAAQLADFALHRQTTDNVSVVLCQFKWK